MEKQIIEYASGNEMAVLAVRQIGYDLMGYYPITPSTQIAEGLDALHAEGKTDLCMIPAEGEHSAAGICYGAAAGGGRVFNATSANGLLYAIEQLPVQSGTRMPMVMNVVCRTVSGPLSIKGDHSDLMYLLSVGWPILFANTAQQVYDLNIIAIKLAERVQLPVVVAYDGFFTSHQKKRCYRFESDETVRRFVGEKQWNRSLFDFSNPISVGAYMDGADIMLNRYELHSAMEKVRQELPQICASYEELSKRSCPIVESYGAEDAKVLLFFLGSSYETAKEAIDVQNKNGTPCKIATVHCLRPFPAEQLAKICQNTRTILVTDRQDSYGAGGGAFSLEVRSALQRYGVSANVYNIVYGLGGQDLFPEDVQKLCDMMIQADAKICANTETDDPAAERGTLGKDTPHRSLTPEKKQGLAGDLGYYGVDTKQTQKSEVCASYFEPISPEKTRIGVTSVTEKNGTLQVKSASLNASVRMPKRLAPGHGACPGCGIVVNLNLLLRAIEDPVVLLFQTGCAMIVTTPYPKTCFKVPYIHNLFQNGAATLSGLAEMCYRKQKKGELPQGDIVFVMVTGDGGMDIGMGCALATAIRGHRLLIFEYDNGGYMNTGYQLSYATPKGAKSATSHVGKEQYGKSFFQKDMAQLMAATGIPYVATAAESHPADFIKKAAKAAWYAKNEGTAYIKALSACPLNWNDNPEHEAKVIEAAVNSCYFPLYEVERGKTALSVSPEKIGRKIPVLDFFSMMGRTAHLAQPQYADLVNDIQEEVDRRYERIKACAEHPLL